MEQFPVKNAPLLSGWVIAAAVGAVAFGAAYGPVGLSANGAVFVAAILFVVVGVILGLPRGDGAALTAPQAAPAPEPVAATGLVAPATAAGRPAGLSAPRGDRADDLKQIKGVGPKLEQMLHGMGYFHFDQIAAWTPAEVAWVDDNLEGFKGRVTRDAWVAQARALAQGAAS